MNQPSNQFTYQDIFIRNILLYGEAGVAKLRASRVTICGLGGVGSYIAEALVRSGIGTLQLVDFDTVDVSNLNRQLPGLINTIGRLKAEVVAERLAQINPECNIEVQALRINAENVTTLGHSDYLIDAIDDPKGKLALICYAKQVGIPIASSMGAGLRLAPEKLRLADISQTHTCPLARRIRKRLKKLGIYKGVKVVFSEELPQDVQERGEEDVEGVRRPLGSNAFVPATAGLLLASLVVRELLGIKI
jgi:tRNA A37 threonylcarbamoyladenosine dehydratase